MRRQAQARKLIGLLAAATALAAHPQTLPAPVHWFADSVAALSDGARFQVALHAAIDPGWHLYALQQPDAFPLATEIALRNGDPAELLRVDQERPHHTIDPESHVVTNYFVQSALFTLRLRAKVPPHSPLHEIHVLVRYQACNDRLCLPPRSEDLAVTIPGRR